MNEKSFNPYDEEFFKLEENIKQQYDKISKLNLEISNVEKNRPKLLQKLDNLEKDKNITISEIDKKYSELNEKLSILDIELKINKDKSKAELAVSSVLGRYANVFTFAASVISDGISIFKDTEEDKLNKEILAVQKKLRVLIKDKDDYILFYKKKKSDILSELRKIEGIDINSILGEKKYIKLLIKDLESNFEKIKLKKKEIDNYISPYIVELKEYQMKLLLSEGIKKKAEEFDNLLKAASSYERKRIHSRCESELGDSSPSKIINSERKKIEGLKRSISKLDSQIRKKVRYKTREIKEVIIDGNNLCYANGNVEIGLDAIFALVQEIKKRYPYIKINLFFDNSISRIVPTLTEDEIKKSFEKIDIECNICKEEADPWIVNLASENKTSYIISNDRFYDFFDKPAIKSKRIFQHQITENTISVLDLDIEHLKYKK